jgi:hypothetical protein
MPDSITPPPELIGRWEEDWHHSKVKHIELEDHIANEAAQWGANQELEACCEWFQEFYKYKTESWVKHDLKHLRAARRPKPPSLKKQALEQLRKVNAMIQFQTTGGETSAIRRALETLDD